MHKPGSVYNVYRFLANLHDYEMLPLAKFQLLLFLLKMSDCAIFHWPGLRVMQAADVWLCSALFYSTKPSEEWLHELSAK